MGYYSHFEGRIEIDPPIRWKDLRDSRWIDSEAYVDLRIEVDEHTTETPDGEALVKRGVAVVPWQEDPYKGYNVVTTLNEIIKEFPEHRFDGEIRVEGEEAGDIWRLVVKDSKAKREDAVVVWPDGSKAGGR